MNITVGWSDAINVVAILVTLYSIWKKQTAEESARVARQKLLNQRAVEQFDEMVRGAASLSLMIRNQEWRQCAELSTALRISLARANGSWPDLLKGLEKDKLEVAAKGVQSLAARIPAQGEPDGELLQPMIEQSNLVIDVVAEIAGRLKYTEEE